MGFTSGTSLWPREWYDGVRMIAGKSPVLHAREHLRSELTYNSAIRNDGVSGVELAEIRASLCGDLENTEVAGIVNKLNFAQCIFLLSVCRLEVFRVQCALGMDQNRLTNKNRFTKKRVLDNRALVHLLSEDRGDDKLNAERENIGTGFLSILSYLEDVKIQKDKDDMWKCIVAVGDKVFKVFLDLLEKMVGYSFCLWFGRSSLKCFLLSL